MHSGETRFGAGLGQRDPPGTGLRAGGVVAQCSLSVRRWKRDGGVKGAEQGVSAELPRAPYPPCTGYAWPLGESEPLAGVSPCPVVRADPPSPREEVSMEG